MINKPEFEIMFKAHCEICNKQMNETLVGFYFEKLKNAEMADLKKAFSLFTCKLKFASVEELMRECCLYTPKTRREQQEIEDRQREQAQFQSSRKEEKKSYEAEYGEMFFRIESTTEEFLEQDTKKYIDNCLTPNGWEIIEIKEKQAAKKEIHDNKFAKIQNIFFRFIHAEREKGWDGASPKLLNVPATGS
jgi:hypothetical protein